MRYLLPDYDVNRFQLIDDLVRLCYFNPLNNKWGYPWNQLTQIGVTHDGLSESNLLYIESNSDPVNTLNGVCFHGPEDFKIWLNPDIDAGSLIFELTLLHELCHGYIGPVMHGKTWRRYFGRVLILYGQLVDPDFQDAEWHVKHTVRRYWSEEHPKAAYSEQVIQSDLELETVISDVEKNYRRITEDFNQLQEMRKGCHASTSATTPTPAYLASLPRKVGTESLSK